MTLDSLRADHLGLNGYKRNTSPNIDALVAKSGLRGRVNYTSSPSTMGAFPAILTSTRALSFGGFDHGAFGRPNTLGSFFAKRGYKSIHLCTLHWASSLFGYGQDLHAEHLLMELTGLANTGPVMLGAALQDFRNGTLSDADFVEVCQPIVESYLKGLSNAVTALEQGQAHRRPEFSHSRFGSINYRWDAIRRVVDRAVSKFHQDPCTYIIEASHRYRDRSYNWIIGCDWRSFRTHSDKLIVALDRLARPLTRVGVDLRIRRPVKHYPDAEGLVSAILREADNARSSDRPFYIWTHLFDSHIPYSAGAGPGWVKDTARWLKQVDYSSDIDPMIAYGTRPRSRREAHDWIALYDAAIAFLDAQIGRLRRELDRLGLADTIIAITSDHGEEFGEHGDFGHAFRLYEHNTRIETLCLHPDLKGEDIAGLTTVLDLAPTLAELAGFEPDPGWEGASLLALKAQPRDEVLLEGFFGSPCDIKRRPPYFAVRRGDWKMLWCERPDTKDRLSKPGPQLFDLRTDPQEENDRSADNPHLVSDLMHPIEARLAELRRAAALPEGSSA